MRRLELNEIQDFIYKIFVEFDRICRKHGIKYSMEGGTLLGAVKYQNYVPWDDDIDVTMLRSEYEKFLLVAPGELPEDYFLQSHHNVKELPQSIREKLFVIVPMQYGRLEDKEYLDRVEKIKNSVDFDCVILREYVPFEMSARLAVATDVYLHLRDTDAFSNALKEHVFAGSYIITGSWLKYIELEEMRAPMTIIDSFDELRDKLVSVLSNFEIEENFKLFYPMYDLYSSDKIIEQWCKIIDFATK